MESYLPFFLYITLFLTVAQTRSRKKISTLDDETEMKNNNIYMIRDFIMIFSHPVGVVAIFFLLHSKCISNLSIFVLTVSSWW